MKLEDIPDVFVSKFNMWRLVNEARSYRYWRNIFLVAALLGWGGFIFLLARA